MRAHEGTAMKRCTGRGTDADRVASQYAAEDTNRVSHELRVFYANVGQTQDMWTCKKASEHVDKFARTVEILFLYWKADVVCLCELGHHSRGLAGSRFTAKDPKEVPKASKRLFSTPRKPLETPS